MEQKKKEKDVLIVRDEKTGEIGVIAGLGKDGNPKLSPPKAENKGDFLHFDKHSNPLETFLSNFYRQCKEPKRFGFYRVAVEGVEDVIDVFKELLKDPEANKDLLKDHRVDTSPYEQQAQAASEGTKQEHNDLDPFWQAVEDHWFPDEKEQPEQKPEEKQKYHPIDESRIDWQRMEEQYGVSREALEASGDLKKMLNYGKSGIITTTPDVFGSRIELDARLSFKELPDGTIGLVPHTLCKEPKLDAEFHGHTFTPEDKENLKKTGNMGRVVDLLDKSTGELIPSYISIDRLTNQIEAVAVKDVRIPNKIGKTTLTDHEISELRAGRPIPNKEIELASGKKFTTTLQVNVERRDVEFVRSNQQRQNRKQQFTPKPTQADGEQKPQIYKHRWEDDKGNIRAPKTMGGVELTPEQQKDFIEGKAILVKDMRRDGKGEPFTAYVKYSFEIGKPKYYPSNPDVSQGKVIAPANESRTQVAVNTEGKTNEATKHVKEPLKQGQAEPTQQQQRKYNKPKGVGM